MRTWLKAGLIGIGVAVILTILSFLIIWSGAGSSCPGPEECPPSVIGSIGSRILYPFAVQCEAISGCYGMGCFGCLLFTPIIMIIELFLLGALIGLIIEKLKK